MKIFGAGLAGLLTGCHFQNAEIIESSRQGERTHKAVLRFRSKAVGDAVGVEFKKVKVHKGIWDDNEGYLQPNIRLANFYSKKVIGLLTDRSIWNLEPCDRYIAPETFIEELVARCSNRISWESHVTDAMVRSNKEIAISTLPMNLMCAWCEPKNAPVFRYKKIEVVRYRISGADIYQTIYIPDPSTNLYRVSITGDLLIAEYVDGIDNYEFLPAFGLQHGDVMKCEYGSMRYGKINDIDDEWRKKFIYDVTTKYNIYSLGRFATWRNILLDDVIKDINVLKKMMKVSAYDRTKLSI